jgi:hypothetical protein
MSLVEMRYILESLYTSESLVEAVEATFFDLLVSLMVGFLINLRKLEKVFTFKPNYSLLIERLV